MDAKGYPGLQEHRSHHEAFVADFLRHKELVATKGFRPSVVMALSEWLGSWLREHVRKVDGEMGHFLRSLDRA